MDQEMSYTSGHKCVPNGVGDYTFICPTFGPYQQFIPFMYRTLLAGTCQCGVEFKYEGEL
jgi:hypothetical protein